jgi:undecaprenyl-diphosphatase|tara:strand:+ start:679 stop:1506 length:828 start_codon:yes stop_codon:yes gene_type:complete
MPIFHAIVLGITQGLTEFFPVSSSGHLELVPWLFQWNHFEGDSRMENTFDVALHLGTLSGLVLCLWGDVQRHARAGLGALVGRQPWDTDAKIGWLLLLSAAPAAIAATLLEPFLLKLSDRIGIILIGLALFGLLLWLVDSQARGKRSFRGFSGRDALKIGTAQSLALLPGVSRSGITITVARMTGYDRPHAARLAFLMGIPIIAGAGLHRSYGVLSDGLPAGMWPALIAGTLTAAITGWVALKFTLRWVQSHSYAGFAMYRVILAAGAMLVLYMR